MHLSVESFIQFLNWQRVELDFWTENKHSEQDENQTLDLFLRVTTAHDTSVFVFLFLRDKFVYSGDYSVHSDIVICLFSLWFFVLLVGLLWHEAYAHNISNADRMCIPLSLCWILGKLKCAVTEISFVVYFCPPCGFSVRFVSLLHWLAHDFGGTFFHQMSLPTDNILIDVMQAMTGRHRGKKRICYFNQYTLCLRKTHKFLRCTL